MSPDLTTGLPVDAPDDAGPTRPTLGGKRRTLVRDDGTRLHYLVVGDGPQDVLLAHGLTSTGALEWRYLVPLLAQGHRCLVPDLRGHGDSDHSELVYGWDAVVDDLRALLVHEGSEHPHLVGFSFGSECVLRLAAADPRLPRSLTLLGTSTGRPAALGDLPRRPTTLPPWPEALKRAHADKHGPDHWHRLVTMMADRWTSLGELSDEALAAITCPTLVVVGEHELGFKLDQARRLPATLPDVQVVEVPGIGHEVHILARDVVEPLVLAHVTAAGADRASAH